MSTSGLLSRVRKLERHAQGQEWRDPLGWNRKIKEAIQIHKETGEYPPGRAGHLVRKMNLAAKAMESLYVVEWPEEEEEDHER